MVVVVVLQLRVLKGGSSGASHDSASGIASPCSINRMLLMFRFHIPINILGLQPQISPSSFNRETNDFLYILLQNIIYFEIDDLNLADFIFFGC